MAVNFKKPSKKATIITTAIIIVLLIIAATGTVVFLRDRGTTEATAEMAQEQNYTQNESAEGQTQTGEEQTAPEEQANTEEVATQEENVQETESIAQSTSTGTQETTGETAGSTAGTAGNESTGTTTATEEIQESTITRTETVEIPERKVSEDHNVWWEPMSINAELASAKINPIKDDVKIEKKATTEKGNDYVVEGEKITYTITVTNNSGKTVEVKDAIPEKTTYVASSATEGATEVKENENVIGLIWNVEEGTTEVSFTVVVNEGAEGTIRNIAIANGEESNPVETPVVIAEKVAVVTNAEGEEVEKAKIGDKITYTITVKNTGSTEATVNVQDAKLQELVNAGIVSIDEASKEVTDKLIAGTEVKLGAGEEKQYVFTVTVLKTSEAIVNVATIDETEITEITETEGIEVVKEEISTPANGTAYVLGEEVIYRVTVTNTGSTTLTNINVTDLLAGIELESDSNIIASLAPGASDHVDYKYKVTKADLGEEIYNKATAKAEEGPEDSDDETVPTDNGISIEKAQTTEKENDYVVEGETITYTVTVRNASTKAVNVKITDTIPEGTTYVAGSASKGATEVTNAEGIVTSLEWNNVRVSGEGSKTVTFQVKVNEGAEGTVRNVATVQENEEGSTPEESNEVKVPIVTGEKVAVVTNSEGQEVEKAKIGDKITYTITVKNTGDTEATVNVQDAKLQELVNAGILKIDEASKEVTDKLIAGIEVKLGAGEEKQYTFTVTVTNINGAIENIATIDDTPITEITETEPEYVSISGTKTWITNDPSIIGTLKATIVLKQNGIEIARQEITGNGSYDFGSSLPKYDNNGNLYNYTVEELPVEGYTSTAIPTTNGTNFINTIDRKTTISGQKIWDDANDIEGRPEEITIKLYVNGQDTGITTTTSAEKGWAYSFGEQPMYDASGKLYEYSVKEVEVEGYTTIESEDSYDITNHKDVPRVDIDKVSKLVNGNAINADTKLKIGDKVTYEITVSNIGNVDLSNVKVTDDHTVTVSRIYKVDTEGNRTRQRTLEAKASQSNLLGTTQLAVGEKYVIVVTYTVDDNTINEADTVNGDKLINNAYVEGTYNDTTVNDNDDDKLTKHAEAIINQSKTSEVEGNEAGDTTVQKGDIIEYTITVGNTGNISGITTVTDSMLKENIIANKITMVNTDGTDLSGEANYTTNCISITTYNADNTVKATSTTNVNQLAEGLGMTVDNGETVVITFKVKVGNLLPGDTIVNELEGYETEHIENDVEAQIQINKVVVNPQETVLVIDISRSMAEAVDFVYNGEGPDDPFADTYEETRWHALETALDTFLRTYMGGTDNQNAVTIIGYNENTKVVCPRTTSLSTALASYDAILTPEQFTAGRAENPDTVDSLEVTDSELGSGTNVEAGLYTAYNNLNATGKLNGAKVILMTDGEANKTIDTGHTSVSAEVGINAAKPYANLIKANGTRYTVSLSLGTGNQTYIDLLGSLSSGAEYQYNTNSMSGLIEDFEEISTSLSSQTLNTVTRKGIVYLGNSINVDGNYVKEVVLTIPDQDGVTQTFTLTWGEFTSYYNEALNTININSFASSNGITAITGQIGITINVDTTIQNNN